MGSLDPKQGARRGDALALFRVSVYMAREPGTNRKACLLCHRRAPRPPGVSQVDPWAYWPKKPEVPERTPHGLFMWVPLCHLLCLYLCRPLCSGVSPLGPSSLQTTWVQFPKLDGRKKAGSQGMGGERSLLNCHHL